MPSKLCFFSPYETEFRGLGSQTEFGNQEQLEATTPKCLRRDGLKPGKRAPDCWLPFSFAMKHTPTLNGSSTELPTNLINSLIERAFLLPFRTLEQIPL
jgi:hypothetical protein